MARIINEKPVETKQNLGNSLKKDFSVSKGGFNLSYVKLLYVLGGLLFVVLISFFAYKLLFNKGEEPNINVQTTSNVCQVEFNIGTDTSVPNVTCSKTISGYEDVSTPEITVGSTLTYVLKLSNPSNSTKSVTVKRFLDEFMQNYSEYIEVLDVDAGSSGLNCSIHKTNVDMEYGTIACGGNPVINPGQTLNISFRVKVIKEFSEAIKNKFTSKVETSDGKSKNLVCNAQFKAIPTPPNPQPGIACESQFTFADGSPVNRPVKPGDMLKINVSALNTGNTNLTGVVVSNPLDTIFALQGAQNLEWLEFKDFAPEVPDVIKTNCTVPPNFTGMNCTNIDLNTSATLDIAFLVTVKNNIGANKTITNVSKVAWQNLVEYCQDSVTTAPINSVCSSNNTCEVVYRDVQNGEQTCQSDNDCVTPTRLVCRNEACVEVEGSGPNECSSNLDCKEEPTAQAPKPKAPQKEEEVAYAIPETAGTPWQRVGLFLVTGFLFVITAAALKKSTKDY